MREPKKLYEAMAHIPLAGGKRLRPVMAQLTCEMVGGDGSNAIPFAAALEIIHNFTFNNTILLRYSSNISVYFV